MSVFILYMNDLPSRLSVDTCMYADDSILYLAYENSVQAEYELNRSIEYLTNWARIWKVTFNPNKTTTVNFSRKVEPTQLFIQMEGTPIELQVDHKHLGVVLQSNAKWKTHIQQITTRAQQRVDIMRSYTRTLDRYSLTKIYICYIRPLLEYADVVWAGLMGQEQDQLESVQLAAMRTITGAKRGTSHHELYSETGLEHLEERPQNHRLVLLYKIINEETTEVLRQRVPHVTT